jgi:hypothetical protein
MKEAGGILDMYNLRARMFPMFLVLGPVWLGLAAWLPLDYKTIGSIVSLLATLGVSTLMQQLARDAGKSKEQRLYDLWGGKPSVRMLFYAHSKLNRQTLARCHAKLKQLAPELRIPANLQEETQNSADALFAYESCNDLLISKTRDKEKFGLLFEENMNYGYRRNLWGLKPWGILTAVLGLVAATAHAALDLRQGGEFPAVPVACAVVALLLLVIWTAVVTPDWVRRAAEAYAQRLITSCDQLESPDAAKEK